MLQFIVVFCLVLLPAAILWAIPKTRRSSGNAVTAWKCVPPGCSVMLLTPVVMDIADRLLNEYGPLTLRLLSPLLLFGLVLLLTVPAGFAVIKKLKNCCWKHYPPDQPRKCGQFYVAFIALLIAVPIIIVTIEIVSFSIMLRSAQNYRGPWRTYPVVTEHGTELAFQERSIHPFLAEYDYRFRFRKNGQETFQDLWINTGGRTYFNVFRLKNGRLLFSDKNNDYIVEVKSQKVYMLEKIDDVYYAGLLPEGKFDSFGFSQGQESGKVHLHIGKHFIDAEPVTDQLADPKYIGCITTGFFSASEKPYQPVEKRFFSPMKISGPAKPKKETNHNNDKGRK